MNTDDALPSIEESFYASWDRTQQFYREFFHPREEWYMAMQTLIAELRKRGYDRKLRAGQSMQHFIVSRAKGRGLRSDDPYLEVIPYSKHIKYRDSNAFIQLSLERLELNPKLEELLERLVKQPIT